MTKIESPRTHLRRLKKSDLSNMIELESNPEVMKHTSYRIPQTNEQTLKRLLAVIESQKELSPLGIWVAELKTSKEFVGWFMLVETGFESPELGFMLKQSFWGQGLATEIAKTIINYGLHHLKYPSIIAITDPDNQASIKVLLKSGMNFSNKITHHDQTLNLYKIESDSPKED